MVEAAAVISLTH